MGIGKTSSACWASIIAALVTALTAAIAPAQQVSMRKADSPPSANRAKAHAEPAKQEAPDTDNKRTQFIISLERRVEPEVRVLSNPDRVLIDLPQVGVGLPDPPGDSPVGVVKSFQHMFPAPGKVRIVIDVTEPVVIERKAVEKSPNGKLDRLVLDIVAASGTSQPPLPKRAHRPYKPVIVIDPGHGGDDSGARKFGTVEKDVVLSFSLKLRDKLKATGFYRVEMTRDRDVFIPLEERRAFAERKQAALFIAIHADYTQRASARGATIYSLRPQVADALRRSAEEAATEAGLSGKQLALVTQAGAEVADIAAVRGLLTEKARDLIERNSLRTTTFARSVINFVGSSTNLMENPDRNAAFVVLKTAKVPAILLELGYVTNVEDAEQLKSDHWREKVSSSVATAINQYMHTCIDMARC